LFCFHFCLVLACLQLFLSMAQQQSTLSTLRPETQKETSVANLPPNEESRSVDNKRHMDILLRQARRSLEDFFKPDFLEVSNEPSNIFQEAKGILFAIILKDSHIGAGIFFWREADIWSPPCAVLVEGTKLGLAMDFERTKHVLVFKNEQYLTDFINADKIILKNDNSISTLSVGRDYDYDVEVHTTGFEEIKKVSTVKGTNLEDSLEGLEIRLDDKWNYEFYKKSVTAKDIFSGNVQVPFDEEYNTLRTMLEQYSFPMRRVQNKSNIENTNENPELRNLTERNENFATGDLGTKNSTRADTSDTCNVNTLQKSESNVDSGPGFTRNANFPGNSSDKRQNATNIESEALMNKNINRDDRTNMKQSTFAKTLNKKSDADIRGTNNIDSLTDTTTTDVYPSNMIGADNKQTNYNVGLHSSKKY